VLGREEAARPGTREPGGLFMDVVLVRDILET
jgi:hypothetical protein